MSNDAVNSPSHYNKGKIEVIDAIDDWGLNFCKGNAVKYVARSGLKDPAKEVEDLEKAIWYLNHEIKKLKTPVPPFQPFQQKKHNLPSIPGAVK